jgi:hypothetical protein
MPVSVKIIENLVGKTKVGFGNAKEHLEIREKILDFGYDEVRLDSLVDLNGRLDSKYHDQQTKRGEQLVATRNLLLKLREERRRYRNFRSLISRAIRGEKYEKHAQLLGIDEGIRKSLEGFIKQARQLYVNAAADTEIMGLLTKFGITAEKLQEALTELDELNRLNKIQESKKGLAQIAREERDKLYKELRTAWVDFKQVCHIAFQDDPQYKEILGIVAPSEGYVRKKATEPEPENPETPETPETPVTQ